MKIYRKVTLPTKRPKRLADDHKGRSGGSNDDRTGRSAFFAHPDVTAYLWGPFEQLSLDILKKPNDDLYETRRHVR